ncbi:LETM1 domain-containing protein YLH47, mitochondrial [Cladophialophora carrionii]|uniref:LETM1 domain-containing protein YLH47, mitochondrial n=1 Tax=Cladophialophora carrionii TaxID=86049 RepID=A0A1C1D258_9EURO|nr:LETM1 domain-containing protein YLH47, mitochondrial [Cladophialophora carrionii]
MSSGPRIISNAAARRLLIQSYSRVVHSSSLTGYAPRSRFARDLPPKLSALAIALPQRNYATETTPSGTDSGPPPGFNIDEAKKPLAEGGDKKSASSPTTTPWVAELKKSDEQLHVPKSVATATAKTRAIENASLGELAAEKAASAQTDKQNSAEVVAKKEESKKLTLGQKIKKEIQHYWDGTKLLAAEVKISSKLALKMAAGYELSRRENRQDLGRLVPFSVFVIVPFAELLLPVALKLFPNLLPSTYEGQKSRETKAAHLRETRKQVSSFLRNTLRETGLPVSAINAKKEEFTEFFRKVRATGESPSKEDVIKVCKIFKDDLTLDNLSRPQLVGMCKYMNLNTFGTDAMLRYQIRHRMRQIKRDDKAISFEGVDSLSVPELQMACASRGLRTHGMSPGKLREDLQMWLDLRLKYNIPSTLLVLSNAYMYTSGKDSEIDSQIDALQAVLSSIPEELFHEIELEVHNAEGAATNKQRLEVLKEQQELIEEENEQAESSKQTADAKGEKSAASTPKDDKDIDEKPKPKPADSEKETKKADAKSEAQEAEDDVTEQGKQEQAQKTSEPKKE